MKSLDKSIYAYIVCNIFIPLILGGYIYVFYRSINLNFWNWLNNYSYLISLFRDTEFSFVKSINLPNWVIFNLPDGLWSYAFCSFFFWGWKEKLSKSIIYFIPPFGIPLFLELLQLTPFVSGTFDMVDLYYSIIGFTLSYIVFCFFKNHIQINEIINY